MDIGIVGAGSVWGTLARKLVSAGHRVRIANSKDPSTLAEFEEEDGITAMWAADAVDGAEVAILSVPQKGVSELSEDVLAALSLAPIVIDTGNYYPARDGQIDAIDQGLADSQWVSSHLRRSVFKVFNNISAPSLKHSKTTAADKRLAISVAGPATEDKQKSVLTCRPTGFRCRRRRRAGRFVATATRHPHLLQGLERRTVAEGVGRNHSGQHRVTHQPGSVGL